MYAQGHVGHGEAVAEFPAGHAALGDFQQGGAGADAVAQADVVFGPAVAAEVFAEGAGCGQQRMGAELFGPGAVVFSGVVVDGFFDAAMYAQVALFIAGKAHGGDCEWAGLRGFGDGAV
ncbi:hypothetical protein D9M73_180520 [compost metagenome]